MLPIHLILLFHLSSEVQAQRCTLKHLLPFFLRVPAVVLGQLKPTQEQQDNQNHQDQAYHAARVITPLPAVRPSGYTPNSIKLRRRSKQFQAYCSSFLKMIDPAKENSTHAGLFLWEIVTSFLAPRNRVGDCQYFFDSPHHFSACAALLI